jgi:hypothetical protein
MNPSSELHDSPLAYPEKHWIERFFQSGELGQALQNREGPALFRLWKENEIFPPLKEWAAEKIHLFYLAGTEPAPELLYNQKTVVSVNPDDWNTQTFQSPCEEIVFYFENPSLQNGYALPQSLFLKLLSYFSDTARKTLVANDTLACFAWERAEEVARPQSAKNAQLMGWQTYLYWELKKILPEYSPPRLYWSAPQNTLPQSTETLASPIHWKLLERELARYPETTRRKHLALRNLKSTGEKLRTLIQNEEIRVQHWPLAGAWIEIEITPKSTHYEAQEWLSKRLQAEGLCVNDKDFPKLRMSYLRETKDYEAALEILTKCLISGQDLR